jgi:hypothetical protein
MIRSMERLTALSEVTTMLGLKFSARVESDIGDLRFGYALCKNPTSPKTGEKWGTRPAEGAQGIVHSAPLAFQG